MSQSRFYRNWVDSNLVSFAVKEDQTDILISAERNLSQEAKKLITKYRNDIIDCIKENPEFKTSIKPLPEGKDEPEIVKAMKRASSLVGVGPMAAVAGAVSEFVGKELLKLTDQIILENGGDIFIKTSEERLIGIFAGASPLSGKISIRIKPHLTPLGICTSSGTIGHSLSFGKADAVCVVSQDSSLADACATATCNRVKKEADIQGALKFTKSVEGIIGAVVIYKNRIGTIGEIELV